MSLSAIKSSFDSLGTVFCWGCPHLSFSSPGSLWGAALYHPLVSPWIPCFWTQPGNLMTPNCSAWLPLTVSICPLLQKDPVPFEMNVKTPDLLQTAFPYLLHLLKSSQRSKENRFKRFPVKCSPHRALQWAYHGSFLHLPQLLSTNRSNIDFPGVCLQSL